MFAELENDTEGFWNRKMLASADETGCGIPVLGWRSRHLVMKDRTTPAKLLHTGLGDTAQCHCCQKEVELLIRAASSSLLLRTDSLLLILFNGVTKQAYLLVHHCKRNSTLK